MERREEKRRGEERRGDKRREEERRGEKRRGEGRWGDSGGTAGHYQVADRPENMLERLLDFRGASEEFHRFLGKFSALDLEEQPEEEGDDEEGDDEEDDEHEEPQDVLQVCKGEHWVRGPGG